MSATDRQAALCAMLAEASREETSEWCQLIWDRQTALDVARLGAAEFECRLTEKTDPGAKHLEAVWIERETQQREGHPGGTVASEATKQCRLDLQYEFRLTWRLGSGPMTSAEAEEYVAQEIEGADSLGRASEK